MNRCPAGNHAGPIELRRKMDGVHAQQQCTACRAGVGKRIRIAMLADDGRSIGRWLTAVPGEGRHNSRRRNYEAFLRSPKWKQIRAEVLEDLRRRQGGPVPICEGEDCVETAVSVHHEAYLPILADTPRSKLRGACMRCQLQERQERITRRVLG